MDVIKVNSTTSNEIEIDIFYQDVRIKRDFNGKAIFDEEINEEIIELKNLEYGLKVIITIPAYNEEKTIEEVIKNIKHVMDNTSYCFNYTVLVVNDGSTDNTVDVATKAGAIVYSHTKNKGLAETFRTEMKLCILLKPDIIVHTDADGQYRAEEIPLLIKQVENGYDLVLGSRFKGTIENMPKAKKIGNKIFSIVLSILTKRKISDGQTGFRAFNIKTAKELTIISNHTYTQEQIIRAAQQKYSIKEVPIFFAKRNDGQSRLMRNPLDYAFKAWKNIFRIYFNKKK